MPDLHDHVWDAERWCLGCGISESDVKKLLPKPVAGRPKGSVNYSAISLIAKRLKARGMDWIEEMIDAYSQYKVDKKAGSTDRALLDFWIAALPFLCQTLDYKLSKSQREKAAPRRHVSDASIAALTRMEGR